MQPFIVFIIFIANMKLSQQSCYSNCTCNETEISCNSASKDILNNISSKKNITKLSLINMDLDSGSMLTYFENFTKLRYLDLSQNKLTEFPMLKDLSRLNSLVLRHNKIENLPKKLIDLKLTNLTIDLTHNKINCTCTTVYAVEKTQPVTYRGQCVQQNFELNELNYREFNCNPCSINNGGCALIKSCFPENAFDRICVCRNGQTGDFCQIPGNPTPCKVSKCLNGGICFYDESTNSTICECGSVYSGEFCQTKTDQKTTLDSNVVIAIIISLLLLVLIITFVCWYRVHIRPKRRRMRESRKKKAKNSFDSQNSIVNYYLQNDGYTHDEQSTSAPNSPKEGKENPYPHDPAHNRWLHGRRRCSTILEEKANREGSCIEDFEKRQNQISYS